MCRLIRYIHVDCGHPDRDGRSRKTDNNGKNDLAYVHFCRIALSEADDKKARTRICGEREADELSSEIMAIDGMCTQCAEAARGGKKKVDVPGW